MVSETVIEEKYACGAQELVAGKWIEHVAGEALSVNTEREIVNHRRLLHPNIIKFLEV